MNFQRTVRRLSTMSSPTSNISPFTRAVVAAMRKLYPEKLADSSFDNTGLLLEAPYRPGNNLRNSALLTIDLTQKVADEAIARRDSIIITYHPIIFRPLKSLTQANTQQNTLLRLAQEGISVYSPHTAVDAAPGGLNDWIVEALTSNAVAKTIDAHRKSVITPVKDPPPGFEGAGYGRIIHFAEPQDLRTLVQRAAFGFYFKFSQLDGSTALRQLPEGLSVATPQSIPDGQRGDIKISTVGVCAGSGGSMLSGVDVDLLFTGELSHHEALAATEQGRCVITVFHSNSERGFLIHRMQFDLLEAVQQEIATGELEGGLERRGVITDYSIHVSRADRDPFEVKSMGSLTDW